MSRPSVISCLRLIAAIASVMACGVVAYSANSVVAPMKERVYVSNFLEQGGDGIYLAELDTTSGNLQLIKQAAPLKKASFLALHRNRQFLYSTCEVDSYPESKHGAVAAFKIDASTGDLRLLNHQASGGEGPHYLSLDREGKNALVANYHGGSVAVLPIHADGTLGPAGSVVKQKGSSVNQKRQEGPHPHAIDVDTTNRFVFVPDLGADRVLSYRFNSPASTLIPNEPSGVSASPGAGPRHIVFHPNGKWAYVINELDSTVNVFQCDSKAGTFTAIETVSTLPKGAHEENLTGEIVIHPNGRFLYGSNRGHDSVAVFAIDQTTGKLTSVAHCPAGGRTPRNFSIDPSGKFVLSANLDSDNVTVLRLDPKTGKLTLTADEIKLPQPYCIQFFSPAN